MSWRVANMWRRRAAMGAAAGAAAAFASTAYAKPLPSFIGQRPEDGASGQRLPGEVGRPQDRTDSFNRADSFIDWQGAIDTDYVEALRMLRMSYKLPLDMMRSLATHFKAEAVAGLAGQQSSVRHTGLEPRTNRARVGLLLTPSRLALDRCVCCPPS